MSQLLENLVSELAKLPSVGRRTALRLALHILRQDIESADLLAGSIYQFRREIRHCARCNNLSDTELCPICSDIKRERETICVVEQISDLISIENTRQYTGLYHVLGGVISPMHGVSPADLRIDLLESNIREMNVREVILAIPSTIEGETTSYYITRRLGQIQGLRISSLSRGIAFGEGLEFADEMTIAHALKNRTQNNQ